MLASLSTFALSALLTLTPTVNNPDDRAWSVQRPSRGAHAAPVLAAATIPPTWRPFAACVLDRESGGTLTRPQSGVAARNPSSSASGRWQFLDTSWRRGLAYMVKDRLIRSGMPRAQARTVRQYLQATHISQWPGPFQDAGFAEVVERGGWFHWSLPGSRCNALHR